RDAPARRQGRRRRRRRVGRPDPRTRRGGTRGRRRPRRRAADHAGDDAPRSPGRVRERPAAHDARRDRGRARVAGRGERRALRGARRARGAGLRRPRRPLRRARAAARLGRRPAPLPAEGDPRGARRGQGARGRTARGGAAERQRRRRRRRARARPRRQAARLPHRRARPLRRRRDGERDRRRPRDADARRRRVRRRDRAEAPRGRDRRRERDHRSHRRDGGDGVTELVLNRHKLLATYARQDVTFVDGDGAWLVDAGGKRYLDLFAGIAVVGLGHCHPAPLAAAHEQLDRLWHVSNLYWTEPMQALAAKLSDRFGGEGAFHGRTFGALSVTGQPAKRAAFEPLVPGARFGLEHVGPETAAILLEPVQGEGGVRPLPAELLAQARALADEHGALLVFDEVQTGVGRSGAFFAWQRLGVRPDAVTLAKGLANGLPIGALLVADAAPAGFVPGDHASTFGGNPVACAAACAVVDAVDDELLANVRARSEQFAAALPVRGLGLLLAYDTAAPAA